MYHGYRTKEKGEEQQHPSSQPDQLREHNNNDQAIEPPSTLPPSTATPTGTNNRYRGTNYNNPDDTNYKNEQNDIGQYKNPEDVQRENSGGQRVVSIEKVEYSFLQAMKIVIIDQGLIPIQLLLVI